MKTITHLSIILIAISLCSYSCGRKKCNSILPVPVEFRKYWSFTEGSWWVYKLKDSTDIFDTVTVISSTKEESGYYEEMDSPCSEYYGITLRHSNNYFDWINGKGIETFSTINYIDIVYLFYGPSLFNSTNTALIRGGGIFSYPINLDQNNTEWIVMDTLPVILGTDTLENVIHTSIDTIDFYFAKNIGRVKFSFSDDMIWELVNYNIVSLN